MSSAAVATGVLPLLSDQVVKIDDVVIQSVVVETLLLGGVP